MTGKARWVMPEREFAGVGMTGEPLAPAQKEKASLRRVRSAPPARAREQKHPPKRKSKFVTCAERPSHPRQRTKVHAKKKKQVCDVCGAPTSPLPESESTRQKGKVSLWRVRSAHLVTSREQKYPPKKKKQVCDVCGAPTKQTSENKSTRQKRKSKSATCAERPSRSRREQKYTPKKKKQVCDVCGAPTKQTSENKSTCLKKFPQSEGISI